MKHGRPSASLVALSLLFTAIAPADGLATTNNLIGTFSGWATNWSTVLYSDDGSKNGATPDKLDFVGDTSAPGLYTSREGGYVFYRMRMHIGTVTPSTYSDTLLLLIRTNTSSYYPDFSFTWDSKSAQASDHGLEMEVLNARSGTRWSDIQMDDWDGSSGQKGTNDINGASRTTDGYVRSIDSQPTVTFSNTAFVDIAVSWSYLYNYTPLRSNQTWYIAVGSIANATDHNKISYDVGAGADPTNSLSVGWVDPLLVTPVPEPGALPLVMLGGGSVLAACRFRRFTRAVSF
jgi:hypothetical protein